MKRQAHRGVPLAMLPNDRPVWDDDIDLTLREVVGIAVGYFLVGLAVIAAIVLPLAIGGLLLKVFGW